MEGPAGAARPPGRSRRWGVLYLGPVKAAALGTRPPLAALGSRGEPVPDQGAILHALDGIVVLDGNWSQAKALWWRNPWLLKLRRLVLTPDFRSAYGKLRKEPRPDSLSTIEAIAATLAAIDGDDALPPRLLRPFHRLLARYREARRPGAPPPAN